MFVEVEPTIPLITLASGAEAEPVASLVDTDSHTSAHFIVDDGCYVLVHDARDHEVFRVSSWIFPEAFEVLKTLPSLLPEYKTTLVKQNVEK